MLQQDKVEELIATAMAAEDVHGNPLQLTVRVLTDGTNNAIEVVTAEPGWAEGQPIGEPAALPMSEPISKVYIPADSGLVAMIVSMQSMLPAST